MNANAAMKARKRKHQLHEGNKVKKEKDETYKRYENSKLEEDVAARAGLLAAKSTGPHTSIKLKRDLSLLCADLCDDFNARAATLDQISMRKKIDDDRDIDEEDESESDFDQVLCDFYGLRYDPAKFKEDMEKLEKRIRTIGGSAAFALMLTA
ncbi:hypothetical protein AB5N19_13547 [Seiridium cardinale]